MYEMTVFKVLINLIPIVHPLLVICPNRTVLYPYCSCLLVFIHLSDTPIMTDATKVQVFFDKDYKIRLLDPTKFEKSENLEKECGVFVDKIGSFNEKIHSLVEILESHAQRIDSQKLRVSQQLPPNNCKPLTFDDLFLFLFFLLLRRLVCVWL